MVNKKQSRIVKIILFILLIVVADRLIGFVLYKLYFNQKVGPNYSLNYSLNECEAEVLVFGNSRAQHHYDTRIISESLNMSCFNAGQDGGHSILLPFAQIKIITDRYSPKIIILEFTPEGLAYSNRAYDKLSILLPYYKYPEIRPLVLLRGPYEGLKLISSIYPFNSNLINIVRFNTKYLKNTKQNNDGYIPLNKKMESDIADNQFEEFNESIVDANLVVAFEKIINICKKKNISLFVVNSPRFHKENVTETKSRMTASEIKFFEIVKKNNVNYIDFLKNPLFTKQYEWFHDNAHLNETGAKIFSNMISDSISNQVKNHDKILSKI